MGSDAMSIAGASTAMRTQQVKSSVEVNLLRKSMDNQEQSMQALLQTMPQNNVKPAHLGNNVDFYV